MKMEKCDSDHEWSQPVKAWPDHRIRHCVKCNLAEVWFDEWSEEDRKKSKIRMVEVST